jgi:AcrR family transcriptional regulator
MAAGIRPSAPTGERFVEMTLALIAENGGSQDVNLREISRRVGCAHTNLYNYYPTYQDLLWEAFRRVLVEYGECVVDGLDDSLGPDEYLHRLITNLACYPEQHPGLYRFIASDPINIEELPGDILGAVAQMKVWLTKTFAAVSGAATVEESRIASDIVLAYIDGETLNLINGRVVPGEDVRGRIVVNALRLFQLLIGEGIQTPSGPGTDRAVRPYPVMTVFGRSLKGA